MSVGAAVGCQSHAAFKVICRTFTYNPTMGKIHDAAAKGDVAAVQAALSEGAQVEAVDKEERTALHIAAAKGHVAVVEYLLNEREADQGERKVSIQMCYAF